MQRGEPGEQLSQTAARPPRKHKSLPTRKVTVRLTEGACQQLQEAAERPGVGKSMVVAAALESLFSPRAPVEEVVGIGLDGVHARLDRLEHNLRMITETVALHARYQLAVMPALPQPQHQEACRLGIERFEVLANQVDRRVRQGRPLLQETIERLNCKDGAKSRPTTCEDILHAQDPRAEDQTSALEEDDTEHALSAITRRDGSSASNGRTTRFSGQPDSMRSERANAPRVLSASVSQAADQAEEPQKRSLRVIFSVFLPFAAGYFLSFLFRTINASISPVLTSEFGLDAAVNGLLASVYFLIFAGAQLPIGVLLDRYGPRRVHSALLVMAVGGAALFGNATGVAELLLGRAMIGLGVAAALMAGLKAIVIWYPKERVAFVNGCMITLGSLGAVAATKPTDWLLNCIGWRSLFEILTIATLVTAALVYFAVPESEADLNGAAATGRPLTLGSIFSDPRFLRIAPLSATCIGSSWAMQALWAANWLTDVEGLARPSVIEQLFWMAMEISLAAMLLGTVADRLRRRGVATEALLAMVAGLFILAEIALVLRLPLPSVVPWSVVPVVGAGTVLSYAIIADYFPRELAARANGALNLVHFAWAFVVQYGIGLVVSQWAPQNGHYPPAAYECAFGIALVVQSAALVWFALPWLRTLGGRIYLSLVRDDRGSHSQVGLAEMLVDGAVLETHERAEW